MDSRGQMHVWVTAAAANGAANKAVIRLLSDLLSVARSSILIESGATSRTKRVRVPLSAEELAARLDR